MIFWAHNCDLFGHKHDIQDQYDKQNYTNAFYRNTLELKLKGTIKINCEHIKKH